MRTRLIKMNKRQRKIQAGTTQLVTVLTGTALLMSMANSQAPTPVDVAFVPILAKLRQAHQRIPILLPGFVAHRQEYGPLTPDLGANRIGYTITLSTAKVVEENRNNPRRVPWVCMVHGQSIQTKPYTYHQKRVSLVNGITGWYSPASSDPNGPFATLGWQYKKGQYSMGLTHATQAELVAMANSAIQHPIQPR